MDLSVFTSVAAIGSAVFWLYSSLTISREKEIQRRKRKLSEGEVLDMAGVVIMDGKNRYELIATLRHQAKWNRVAACLTALAILLQLLDAAI